MVKNNFLFYISGLFSFFLFFIIVMLFFYLVSQNTKITQYALERKNTISISIEITESNKAQKNKPSQKSSSASLSNTPKTSKSIKDLFNNVWTKKITSKKSSKNKDRLKKLQKKIKTSRVNNVESLSKKIDELETKSTNKRSRTSSGDEVNEYLGKIQGLVYKYFQPPKNSLGYEVHAAITLNAFGRVIDFEILVYSANDALNAEADRMKAKLMNVIFPKNPNGEKQRVKIILKPDDKE